MCGIVGLFCKNPELELELGGHLSAMLVQMDERGAIYLLTKRDGMIRKLSIAAVDVETGVPSTAPTAPK